MQADALNIDDIRKVTRKASLEIVKEVGFSLGIQTLLIVVSTMLATGFFASEGALEGVFNTLAARFSVSAMGYFCIALLIVLGMATFLVLVFYQLGEIDDLRSVMTSYPRRICEELMKYVISMTSSFAGVGASIAFYLQRNPNHSEHAKWNSVASDSTQIFIMGFLISWVFGVITQHREVRAKLIKEKISAST